MPMTMAGLVLPKPSKKERTVMKSRKPGSPKSIALRYPEVTGASSLSMPKRCRFSEMKYRSAMSTALMKSARKMPWRKRWADLSGFLAPTSWADMPGRARRQPTAKSVMGAQRDPAMATPARSRAA